MLYRLLSLLLLALIPGLSGCDRSDSQAILELDWLASAGVERSIAPTRLAGAALRTPWTVGLGALEQGRHGDPYCWSRGDSTLLELPVLEPGPRRLRLRGFPLLKGDGTPQIVRVELNGLPAGEMSWDGPGERELPIPDGLLRRGRNRLLLRYPTPLRPADVRRNSRDTRRLTLALRELELLPLDGPSLPPSPREVPEQGAPSVWWRWIGRDDEGTLELQGRAGSEGVRLLVLLEESDGAWTPLHRLSLGAGERLGAELELGLSPDPPQRLGVAVLEGTIRWERLRARVAVPPTLRRPNIVLLTLDTTRQDALAPYTEASTPALEALAREGVLFERAYSPAPVTAPTHASLFLSQEPRTHGLQNNGQPLPRVGGSALLPQLKALGYETLALVSLAVLARDTGFAQDFDRYDDAFDERWWRFAEDLNRVALPWIEERPGGEGAPPRFLWVHYADPHKPYGVRADEGRGVSTWIDGEPWETLPTHGRRVRRTLTLSPGEHELRLRAPAVEGLAGPHRVVLREAILDGGDRVVVDRGWERKIGYERMVEEATLRLTIEGTEPRERTLDISLEDMPAEAQVRRQYAAEVEAMDRAVAELRAALERAGWLEDAVILGVGDHGEDLGEDGHFGHVHHIGPTLSDVPMFLWDSTLPPRRVAEPVGVIDVAPTLLARLGVASPESWQGVDALAPLPERMLRLETFPPEAWVHLRGVVKGRWKLSAEVDQPETLELHDLLDDPAARRNLLGSGAQADSITAALLPRLLQWDAADEGPAAPIDPEMVERLRALGYLE